MTAGNSGHRFQWVETQMGEEFFHEVKGAIVVIASSLPEKTTTGVDVKSM